MKRIIILFFSIATIIIFNTVNVFAIEDAFSNNRSTNNINDEYIQSNEVKENDVEPNNMIHNNVNNIITQNSYNNYLSSENDKDNTEKKDVSNNTEKKDASNNTEKKDVSNNTEKKDVSNNTSAQNNSNNNEVGASNSKNLIETGIYIIESAINNNYVLDIENSSQQSGANVRLYQNLMKKNQRFTIQDDGNGYYTITSVNSNKVLDVANAGKKAGTNVWQCWKNESDAQKWTIKDAGDGYFYFISKCNNLCLDVSNGIAENGINIQVCYKNNSKAQKFKLKKYDEISSKQIIEDGIYVIETGVDKNKCLEVANASSKSGGNVHIYGKTGVSCQKVIVKYNEDGYYTFKFYHSGMLLDVSNGKVADHTNVWQCIANNSDAQKWIINDLGNGYYNIISKLSNTYLTVEKGKNVDCTNVEILSKKEDKSQQFKFNKLDETYYDEVLSEGIYEIETALDKNKVLNVVDSSQISGANICIVTRNNSDNQKVQVKYIGEGFYSIKFIHSLKCMDVANAGKKPGTNIWQCWENESDAQKWMVKDTGDGFYNIISKCNGLYLDVANGKSTNGTNVQVCYGNNSKAQMFKFKKTNISAKAGTYGKSGLKIQGNSNGTDLKYYKIGSGTNVFFATFAIHGWEDDFDYDGKELTKIADAFRDKLISMNDINLTNKWTIYIFPSLNPDGEYHGWSHNGPGRTTLYSAAPGNKGIDMNRTWSTDWVKYTTDRNYTGTEPFQSYEARYLRDFLLSHKSINGQTVLVDLHGWLNETMGDDELGSFYRSQLEMSKHISSYGRGYLINWARANLGSNGRTARTVLVELPEAHSSADVKNWGLVDKYIKATINMLKGI